MAARRRGYERGDRLGELLREILADELARIDDERLALVTITGVEVDRDLAVADVYFSTVDLDHDVEAEATGILERYRRRLQGACTPAPGWRRSCGRCATPPAVPTSRRRGQPSRTQRRSDRFEPGSRGLRRDRQGAGLHLP